MKPDGSGEENNRPSDSRSVTQPIGRDSASSSETSRSLNFVPLRTTRACDICKLRKVKCDGGDPCNACRLHQSTCSYSGTTRRQLLSMVGSKPSDVPVTDNDNSSRSASSMPFEGSSGVSQFRDLLDGSEPRYSIGSSSREPDRYQTQSKQLKRTHSELERIPSCDFSTASINAFDQDGRREDERKDNRVDGAASGFKNAIGGVSTYLPLPTFQMDGSSRFSSLPKTSYGTTGFMYPAPPYPASTEMSNPFPMSDVSLPQSDQFSMFPPSTRATESTSSASGSASTKSLLTLRSSVSDSGPFTPPQLTQASDTDSPALDVYRTVTDAFGNAGLTTFRPGLDLGYMEYWGMTSYLGIQDLIARMFQTKIMYANSRYRDKPFVRSRGEPPVMRELDLWRWGCDVYIQHDHIDSDVIGTDSLDPMFLPPELAHRFFHAYKTVIHPLFPVIVIETIRESIHDAYTLGITDPKPRKLSALAHQSHSLERARDLMVMAFGAQIEGGDGDAECHKNVARAWSEILKRKARSIMLEHGQGKGGVDLVNLWVIMAAYSRSYGNSDEELSSVGLASRLTASIGLNREGIYQLPVAEKHGFRRTLCVCYHLEKWAGLCHGIPSNLVRSPEFNAILANLSDQRFHLIPLVDLGDFMGQIQSMFDELSNLSVQAGLAKAVKLYERLVRFRERLPDEFDDFENAYGQGPIDLSTPHGEKMIVRFTMCGIYLQLKMLVLLPILELAVWRSARFEPLAFSDHLIDLVHECVTAGTEMVNAFHRYSTLLPHLSELALSSILLLYAVLIYMDVLRLSLEDAVAAHLDTVRRAAKILEHYDHPAAQVAQAMCHDILTNHLEARQEA